MACLVLAVMAGTAATVAPRDGLEMAVTAVPGLLGLRAVAVVLVVSVGCLLVMAAMVAPVGWRSRSAAAVVLVARVATRGCWGGAPREMAVVAATAGPMGSVVTVAAAAARAFCPRSVMVATAVTAVTEPRVDRAATAVMVASL